MKNLVSEESEQKKKWEMGGSEECLKRIYGCKNVYCFCILSFFFLPVFILGVWGGRERGKGGMYPYLNCCTGCHLTGSLQGEKEQKEACHFE